MTEDQVRSLLQRRAKRTSVSAWAIANGIPKSRVSEFLNGKRAPNDAILEALGLERRIVRKIKVRHDIARTLLNKE